MRSSALLWYIDQEWNTAWGLNENYARELMELHTVGWNGGCSQADVRELARVLTGWPVSGQGIFQYKAELHDFEAKTVFGMTFPARAVPVADVRRDFDALYFPLEAMGRRSRSVHDHTVSLHAHRHHRVRTPRARKRKSRHRSRTRQRDVPDGQEHRGGK